MLISFFDFNHVNFFLLNFVLGMTIFGNIIEFVISIAFLSTCWGVGQLSCKFLFVRSWVFLLNEV